MPSRETAKPPATRRRIDAQRYRGLFVMPRENRNYRDTDVVHPLMGTKMLLTFVLMVLVPQIAMWPLEWMTR